MAANYLYTASRICVKTLYNKNKSNIKERVTVLNSRWMVLEVQAGEDGSKVWVPKVPTNGVQYNVLKWPTILWTLKEQTVGRTPATETSLKSQADCPKFWVKLCPHRPAHPANPLHFL